MWCKTLQRFHPKGMVLLCSRCLDKTCQKYRNIKIPLQTIIDIIILERADLDSLILWCVCIIVTMGWTLDMTAELCWESNFNLMHELIHHIVFYWVVFTKLLLVCHWRWSFYTSNSFEFAILRLLSLNSNLKLLSVLKYWSNSKRNTKK